MTPEVPPNTPSSAGESPLGDEHRGALDRATPRWSTDFGTGSRSELLRECTRGLARLSISDESSTVEDADEWCLRVEHAHRVRYGHAALRAEVADERERDLAVESDRALVRYQDKWQRKLSRLQRAHPERWRVPGLSEEEVRDASTLRLIEAIRTEPSTHAQYCRAGREWGLTVSQQHLMVLRKNFRLGATPMDFGDVPLLQREPSQEERWLELEADSLRMLARRNAESCLSRPQRRWLAAMQFAANCGEFFEASDRLNLSAVSRLLGKNRSSAQRAYDELQSQFLRELERLE